MRRSVLTVTSAPTSAAPLRGSGRTTRQTCDTAPGPERPVRGLRAGGEEERHVHEDRTHEQDREQDGPHNRASHVSLREGSRVSMIMIFCQILRDSPVVSVSTSFTASSSTGSCESWTYNAATLLVSDSSSEQESR